VPEAKPVVAPEPPLVVTVADRGCPPCVKAEAAIVAGLDAAGWVRGRGYVIRVVSFGSQTTPAFSWRGRPFSADGWPGWDEWRKRLAVAMGVTLPAPHAAAVSQEVGRHSHKCPRCGFEWWHGPEAASNPRAHNCPRCGAFQNVVNRTGG
jgi:hypothetical protein